MRREVLQAAAEQLRDMLAPLLGAWAQNWNATGLSPEALAGVLHLEADRHENPTRSRRPFLAVTRALLRFHRPPPYVDPGTGCYTVRLTRFPELTGEPERVPGLDAPRFPTRNPDGTQGIYSEAPGLDLLTLELPDGSAALLPLGYRGELELSRATPCAVRVPTHLREVARHAY